MQGSGERILESEDDPEVELPSRGPSFTCTQLTLQSDWKLSVELSGEIRPQGIGPAANHYADLPHAQPQLGPPVFSVSRSALHFLPTFQSLLLVSFLSLTLSSTSDLDGQAESPGIIRIIYETLNMLVTDLLDQSFWGKRQMKFF